MEKFTVNGEVSNSHRYKTKKGEISLIYPSWVSMGLYEIYCIEGELFDGIERFDTLEDAEQRIYELLNYATMKNNDIYRLIFIGVLIISWGVTMWYFGKCLTL
jgi:hypothetical protein